MAGDCGDDALRGPLEGPTGPIKRWTPRAGDWEQSYGWIRDGHSQGIPHYVGAMDGMAHCGAWVFGWRSDRGPKFMTTQDASASINSGEACRECLAEQERRWNERHGGAGA